MGRSARCVGGRADPLLGTSYQDTYQSRLAQWVAFGQHLVARGVLSPPRQPGTIADLATGLWLIGTNWLPFLEITGDPRDAGQVARGADLELAVLAPYITQTAAAAPRQKG